MPQPAVISRRNLLLSAAAFSVAAAPHRVSPAEAPALPLRLRRLGWAGVLLERGETALFVDATRPDAKRGEPDDLLRTALAADAVITHHHGDHFDPEALRGILGDRGHLVCWRPTLDWIDARALRVQPVDLWQPVFFPRAGSDFVAFAVPAVDGWGAPQVSWVIDAGGQRLFHGGDTQWHGHFADIGRAYGPFDVALLPINGARQNLGRYADLGVPAVLTPDQAVAAAQLLGARLVVPIHFGQPDPPDYVEVADAFDEFRRAAARAAMPIRQLGAGDAFVVERSARC